MIHGGIDGFSRLIVYLHCSDNNRSSTVKENFCRALEKYGFPSRVRCDQGGENYGVAELMLGFRGIERNSVLVGPSVHNQRIERLWRDLFDIVLQLYYRLFYHMERCEILNPLNPLHLFSLHFTFIPRINHAIQNFVKGWNMHPISGQHGKSPSQLFIEGTRLLHLQNVTAEDFTSSVDDLYGLDDEEMLASSSANVVQVPKVANPLSVTDFETSKFTYNPVEYQSNNNGIDIYEEVLLFVLNHLQLD